MSGDVEAARDWGSKFAGCSGIVKLDIVHCQEEGGATDETINPSPPPSTLAIIITVVVIVLVTLAVIALVVAIVIWVQGRNPKEEAGYGLCPLHPL